MASNEKPTLLVPWLISIFIIFQWSALQIVVCNVRDRDTIRAVYHIDKEVRLTCPNKLIVAPSRLLATVKRGQIVVNRDQIAAQSRHFKLASFISRLCINLKFKNWIKSFKIGSKFNFQISFRFLQNQKISIWTWPKLKFEFLFQKLHFLYFTQ